MRGQLLELCTERLCEHMCLQYAGVQGQSSAVVSVFCAHAHTQQRQQLQWQLQLLGEVSWDHVGEGQFRWFAAERSIDSNSATVSLCHKIL